MTRDSIHGFDIRLAFVIGCSTLFACTAEPRLDGSSEAALEESVEEVRASLPQEHRDEFDEAMTLLALSGLDMARILSGEVDEDEMYADVTQKLHGKTGDEVIAEARRIRAQRQQREKEQALAEIRELQQKQQQAERAAQSLERFEVVRSRFYKREGRFGMGEPIIELTVRNGTAHAVSRADFDGVLASPGRSVPWVSESFNYSISGGLEPGEEATWRLAPNLFSKWGTVDASDDAVLTVTVRRIDGPDGEPLYDTRAFGEREQRRLQALTDEYGFQ